MFPVQSGEALALDAWLEAHAGTVTERLRNVTTLHFGRFVLLPEPAGDPSGSALPLLALETSFDGELEPHVVELWTRAGAVLEPLLAHCVGWQGGAGAAAFARYVRAHLTESSAFFAAHPGLTVARVQADARLRKELGRYLDRHGHELPALGALELVARSREALRAAGPAAGFELVSVDRGLAGTPKSTLSVLAGHTFELLRTLVVAALHDLSDFFSALWHDTRAPAAVPALVARAAGEEAGRLMNGLTHVAQLKPGAFRRGALRLALRITDELARAAAFTGRLGGIDSIHFARWVLLSDGRLVFFSNYVGSWESYLGDFVDRASRALTMIWSNTQGFPTTFAWVLGGARDEAGFKHWTRAHQLPTPLWYSAYPELGVGEVLENAELRELLAGELDEAGARRVLEVLRD